MTLTAEHSEQVLANLEQASDIVTALVTHHREAVAGFSDAEAVVMAAGAVASVNATVPAHEALHLTTRLLIAAVHMLATGGA